MRANEVQEGMAQRTLRKRQWMLQRHASNRVMAPDQELEHDAKVLVEC